TVGRTARHRIGEAHDASEPVPRRQTESPGKEPAFSVCRHLISEDETPELQGFAIRLKLRKWNREHRPLDRYAEYRDPDQRAVTIPQGVTEPAGDVRPGVMVPLDVRLRRSIVDGRDLEVGGIEAPVGAMPPALAPI